MAPTKEESRTESPIATRLFPGLRQSVPSVSNNSIITTRTPSHSRHGTHSHHSNAHSHGPVPGNPHAPNRITRRTSMTPSATNPAAVAAALEGAVALSPLPITIDAKRGAGANSRPPAARGAVDGSARSPPASLPAHKFVTRAKSDGHDSAIDDESMDLSAEDGEAGLQPTRVRRASDGQPLTKDGKKSNRTELRCGTCGKGYKHSSCLTKHLWEHTPEWSLTSKLLISKHQQVQLLEAASVLVKIGKDKDAVTPPESARDFGSEAESVSPTASAPYSDQWDGRSSVDTTPPPQADVYSSYDAAKRHSSSSAYAGSYQSTTSNDYIIGSVPAVGRPRQAGWDHRLSLGINATGPEDRGLAQAVGQLTCSSFGSNGFGTSRDGRMPSDAPPVPPVPAHYLEEAALNSSSWSYTFPSMPLSNTRGSYHGEEDVPMVVDSDSDADEGQLGAASEEDACRMDIFPMEE